MTQPDPQGQKRSENTTVLTDHGQAALAEGLHNEYGSTDPDAEEMFCVHNKVAAAIIGPNGLFVADVREHEPDLEDRIGSDHEVYSAIVCSCGHVPQITESYFTHINGGPR